MKNRIIGEIIVGVILMLFSIIIVPQIAVYGNMEILLFAVVVLFTGIAFLNLAYIRSFPKDQQQTAMRASRGGLFAPLAKGIEWLLGIRN